MFELVSVSLASFYANTVAISDLPSFISPANLSTYVCNNAHNKLYLV